MEINSYRLTNLSSEQIQEILKKNERTSLIRIYNGQIIVHPQIRHCELLKCGLIFNNIKGEYCFTNNETLKSSFLCPSEEVCPRGKIRTCRRHVGGKRPDDALGRSSHPLVSAWTTLFPIALRPYGTRGMAARRFRPSVAAPPDSAPVRHELFRGYAHNAAHRNVLVAGSRRFPRAGFQHRKL